VHRPQALGELHLELARLPHDQPDVVARRLRRLLDDAVDGPPGDREESSALSASEPAPGLAAELTSATTASLENGPP
jgi:hypothetical protein